MQFLWQYTFCSLNLSCRKKRLFFFKNHAFNRLGNEIILRGGRASCTTVYFILCSRDSQFSQIENRHIAAVVFRHCKTKLLKL